MSGTAIGGTFFALMLLLLALRVPIAISMFLTGVAGYVTMTGWAPLMSYLKTVAYGRFSVYDLSVVPLFLLMGSFASRGGLSKALFGAAGSLIGHWRGGPLVIGAHFEAVAIVFANPCAAARTDECQQAC